jgi:hypothetical protein
MFAVDFSCIVGLDNVQMVERSRGLHLAFEAGDRLVILQTVLRQDFDRHHPFEFLMPGLEDGSHPAFA